MTYQEAMAKRLRELTLEKGISQAEIVRRTHLSRSTIYSIFSGRKSDMTLNVLLLICRALGITLQDLFKSPLFE